ncbi:MAG: histidine phosphatase family protein, partial [Acidimicrobiales bacterium]
MLILARHGRTEANAAGLLLGRADVALDEVGRAQAVALPGRVGRPARVISSPLQRCRDTAAAFGLAVEVDDRWVELDYGDYDRLPLAEVPAEVWSTWRRDPDFRPPNGESLMELGDRVRAALDELSEQILGADEPGDVVVVTHVSPIKAAIAWVLRTDEGAAWRMRVGVASVSRIAIGSNGPVLH